MHDPIRLYLDEDTISRALIHALRSRSADVLTAKEAGLIQQAGITLASSSPTSCRWV